MIHDYISIFGYLFIFYVYEIFACMHVYIIRVQHQKSPENSVW